MKEFLLALSLLLASTAVLETVCARTPAPAPGSLTRHYREGETLTYHMTAINEDRHYTADASCTVSKTDSGSYVEEFRWTGMTREGKPTVLAPSMAQFLQPLSLDPSWTPSAPDLSKTDPKLVGPILDFMTFYVDLWLMNKIGIFRHPGDHFYMPGSQAASWADGTRVLIGNSHVDFDLNLKSIDTAKQQAVVVIHHVPPSHPNPGLPAEWMQAPVADKPNNWVQVAKTEDGKYEASVGQETFEVTMTVSTADGRILSASMENPVVTSGRECDDAALTKCSDAKQHTIHRHVEIALTN